MEIYKSSLRRHIGLLQEDLLVHYKKIYLWYSLRRRSSLLCDANGITKFIHPPFYGEVYNNFAHRNFDFRLRSGVKISNIGPLPLKPAQAKNSTIINIPITIKHAAPHPHTEKAKL